MTGSDDIRASDADRERVVQALQAQVGEGRLTLAEFEQRSSAAYEAKTIGDLRELTRDLPVEVFESPLPHPWQGPFPMPANPHWVRGGVPMRRSRPHPALIALAVLVGLIVVANVFTMVAWGAMFAFPLFMVLFLVLGAGGGGRRYHRR